jgi:hypothetical protein
MLVGLDNRDCLQHFKQSERCGSEDSLIAIRADGGRDLVGICPMNEMSSGFRHGRKYKAKQLCRVFVQADVSYRPLLQPVNENVRT